MGSYGSEPWTAGPHGRQKGAQDLGVPSAIQRRKILIPMASKSTALCMFISCYHHQPGGQTHSGQRSRFDCVCAGQLVRTVKQRSPIVSSESKGLRPCKCLLPDPIGFFQACHCMCMCPLFKLSRQRSLHVSSKSSALSQISHSLAGAQTHSDNQTLYVRVCVSQSVKPLGQRSPPMSSKSTALSHSQCLPRTNQVNRGCFRVRDIQVISAQSNQPPSGGGSDSI